MKKRTTSPVKATPARKRPLDPRENPLARTPRSKASREEIRHTTPRRNASRATRPSARVQRRNSSGPAGRGGFSSPHS